MIDGSRYFFPGEVWPHNKLKLFLLIFGSQYSLAFFHVHCSISSIRWNRIIWFDQYFLMFIIARGSVWIWFSSCLPFRFFFVRDSLTHSLTLSHWLTYSFIHSFLQVLSNSNLLFYFLNFSLKMYCDQMINSDPLIMPPDKKENPWAEKSKCTVL